MGFGIPEGEMSIRHRIAPRYKSRNHEIVAGLREAAGAGPPVDPKMRVKKLVAEVACLMALVHGGDWKVRIDHQEGLVMIARRGRRGTL